MIYSQKDAGCTSDQFILNGGGDNAFPEIANGMSGNVSNQAGGGQRFIKINLGFR